MSQVPTSIDQDALRAANINPVTLLATDYLNHFNEVLMLIEMLPSMPECAEDVFSWRPMSYIDYFGQSTFKEKDLAIALYADVKPETRTGFESLIATIDEKVLGLIEQITALGGDLIGGSFETLALSPTEPPPSQIGPYQQVTGAGLFAIANELQDWVLDLPNGEAIAIGTDRARVVQGSQRYVYDEASDTLTDNATDQVCSPVEGAFECPDGRRIEPGWRIVIGFENYWDILTDSSIRGPILGVFAWNLVFALGSVLFTFMIGLALAITFNNERMRGVPIYRSIYILPYAIRPSSAC